MSYQLRARLVEIARRNVGKTESSRNQAPWIKELWKATSYGVAGHENREPYCAAGMCWAMMEWLNDEEVLKDLKLTKTSAERWRCKSASVFRDPSNSWLSWAKEKAKTSGVSLIDPSEELHTGDLIIFKHSHIEMFVDDSGIAPDFIAIGYNTSIGGSRDGEGCKEARRYGRANIKAVIRLMK